MKLMVLDADGRHTVARAWEGKTVVCIAGGPSLTQAQVELVRSARERDAVRVIVINDAYLLAPWADVLYFADARWAKWQLEGVQKTWPWAKFGQQEVKQAFEKFAGQKVTIDHPDVYRGPGVFVLKNRGPDGLSERPDGIHTGSNSGFQSLNIAFLSGANQVLLVAYDMKYQGRRTHSHNGHSLRMDETAYTGYATRFRTTVAPLNRLGVKVFNCSPDSAIDAFPKKPLEECLKLGP